MLVKDILAEDFINYKSPSMFISTCFCSWKCCIEQNLDISICQNSALANQPNKNISNEEIFKHFIENPITKAIVIGGLEPFIQIDEILELIQYFRSHKENCPFVIYTGYYPEEIVDSIEKLKQFNNIIIKFGRYIPNSKSRYDNILGITLVSDNQYAKKIS